MYLKYSDDIKLHSMSDLCTVNYVVTSARAVNLAEFKLYPIIHKYSTTDRDSSQVMVFKGDIMTKNMLASLICLFHQNQDIFV